MAVVNNGTAALGTVFELPDMQFRKGLTICVPFGPSEYRVTSFGYFAGEKPLSFPFPALMLQLVCIIFVTRLLYLLLRPLKQPRIVCDVLGGLLLSPDALGIIKINYKDQQGVVKPTKLSKILYPQTDFAIIRTVATFGIMFYFFLVGVKIDPKLFVRSGRRPWAIGIISFALSFAVFSLFCYWLRRDLNAGVVSGPFLLFVVASVSITSFPVLADILAEIHLLNSELGRLAMSSAMVHGVFGSIFMAAFVFVNQGQGGLGKAFLSVASLVVVIVVIVFVFRPWMQWIIKHTPKGGRIDEKQIFAIFVTVMAMGMVSDFIGTSFAVAPFVMGLAVPEGPPLGAALVEKAQLLVSEGLMPLMFVVSGINMKVFHLQLGKKWVKMTSLLLGAYIAKLIGTATTAIYCEIPIKNAFLLGLMMNFRGVVEVLTLLHFKIGRVRC